MVFSFYPFSAPATHPPPLPFLYLRLSPTLSQVLIEDGAKDKPVILLNFLASPAVPARLRHAGFSQVVVRASI